MIGGSIAGCAVAADLLHHGHDVTVYERSAAELASRGAAIITPAPVLTGMQQRGLLSAGFPSYGISAIRYVTEGDDPDGERWLGDVRMDLATIDWSHLFGALRSQVPDDRYVAGTAATATVDQDGSAAVVLPGGAPPRSADLVVAADGYRSDSRRILAPEAEATYTGAVFWRCLLPESAVDADRLAGLVTRVLYPGGHGSVYLLPGADRSILPGRRQVMGGFYLAVPPDDLEALLVDADGRRHQGSIPFGLVRPEVERDFRDRLLASLPPYATSLVQAASGSSIQAVRAVQVARYAHGRLCAVGDAGTVIPPFTGSGVLRAVSGATSLTDALTSGRDVDAALQHWSAAQVEATSAHLPLAERSAHALVFDVPDLASMSVADTSAWLTALHAGSDLDLPA